MATQNYATVASRNLIRAEQQMLKHAEPIIVLGQFGQQREQPQNKTDTVVFRRLNPYNMDSSGAPNIVANEFELDETATPEANTISYTDVSVTLKHWGVLFKFSAKTQLMYEDDIPGDMQKLTGETMGGLAEKIRYGAIKGGTNVLYTNGTTRAGLNTPISLNRLRQAARVLEAAFAMRVTSRLAPGPDFGTAPVEPGFLVFVHTDAEADIRNLAHFTKVEEYASRKPVHAREIGAVENFRFITSPMLSPWLAAGSATLNGCYAANATNVDVYPFVITAEDAWGSVALKGMGAVSPTLLPATQKSHANPMGQVGYVGASFWTQAVRLNENWMVRIEAGVSDLA